MPFQRGLGHREREIMDTIFQIGSGTVGEIAERLGMKLDYNTVLTFVARLHRKGMLQRQKNPHSRSYIYSPNLSARELEVRRAAEFIHRLLSDSTQHPELLLSCFVEELHQYDTELLNQLEAKISAARRASATIQKAPPDAD